VRLRVDLAFQDLLGAGNGDRRNLATQLFASLVGFLLDLRLGCSKLPLAFLDASAFAVGNDFVGTSMGLVKNTGSLLASIIDDLVSLRLCFNQFLLALVSSGETFLNLLLTLFERMQNRRPDELHAEPDKHDHGDRLADESHIDIHVMLLTALTGFP